MLEVNVLNNWVKSERNIANAIDILERTNLIKYLSDSLDDVALSEDGCEVA